MCSTLYSRWTQSGLLPGHWQLFTALKVSSPFIFYKVYIQTKNSDFTNRKMQLYNVFAFPIVRDQLIANTIFVALATVLVILRGISRRIRKNHIGWDDACCVAGLFHTYGMLAMHFHYARVGMRHHIKTIPPENAVLIAKMLMVYQIVYYNAMVLAKFSYLAFYLRIFVSREFRILTWVCMGCAGAYWTGSMLQIFLICTPFERNWNPTLPGHCASQNVAFSTIGAFNLLTDVMIMALPIRFVWKLQMSLATKLAVVGIFGLGILYVFWLSFSPRVPVPQF